MFLDKMQQIKEALSLKSSALVAFSGGVDSSTLAALAYETLGDQTLAAAAVHDPGAVSYTHLDVYKRQALSTASIISALTPVHHQPFQLISGDSGEAAAQDQRVHDGLSGARGSAGSCLLYTSRCV